MSSRGSPMATRHDLVAYRCIWEKRPEKLLSSRKAGRWNEEGDNVIYASESRALAAFEVFVHLDSDQMLSRYKFQQLTFAEALVKFVEVPDVGFLRNDKDCQAYGHSWYLQKDCAILRVPSTVILREYNFVINLDHPDANKIKIAGTELFFEYDGRLRK